jgi:glucan 1,4-alpha-glucosidase
MCKDPVMGRALLLAVAALGLLLIPAAGANTPAPTSVTVAGDLQSELGCSADWLPDCATTHLNYDATSDVWRGTFMVPAGNWNYKAALNDSWTENYGLNAQPGGANIPLNLSTSTSVKFYYDHKTHWITDNHNSLIPVAVGDFQSKLGCSGDWDPGCLRSWLEDPSGSGVYTFETTALPHGSYQAKVALNESWDENYGAGGVAGGANIPFTVPVDGTKVTFSYDPSTHVLSIAVAAPAGAPGWPGALSHFDLARKDCLGTARNTTSKVWYTVANGVLSDVYYPTVDNTNVETMQYVVTDGSTFTDLQTRDMTYTVASTDDAGGMACTVTATAKSGKYSIETEYITDPSRNSVLMKIAFDPHRSGLQLFARFDPTVNGNGGGGAGNGGGDTATIDSSTGHPILVSSDTVTTTNAANRDYAQPVFAALDGSFNAASSGFVGTASDGLTELDATHALAPTYTDAINGNVEQTARITLGPDGKTVLALGFGATQGDAVGTAEGSLQTNFQKSLADYKQAWKQYDNSLTKPHTEKLPGTNGQTRKDLEDEYYLSANVIKASEDKTFPGAIVASLASPWGQAVSAGDPNNTYFGSYREVFARDLYEAWTGLFADGDLATARDATLFLFDRQQLADGSMPRNSLVNGKPAPDTGGIQLDEAAYPILMADQLHLTDSSLYTNHIKPAANFIAAHGPAFGVERWEEQDGYSPSTIAAEIAGLVAAADLARANGDATSAAVWLGVADDWQRSIKGWTVTTTGPFGPSYFIRLSKTGDPNAAIFYGLGNGGPTLDQRSVIDAGFLELVRLGELRPTDPDIVHSLPVVDATIESTTPSGPGWHRYNGDGYGDGASDGHPWAPSGVGTGHLWPVLSAERGEQDLVSGDASGATALLQSMDRFASGVGLIPEQDWELPDLAASPYGTDPTIASIGFKNGGAAGSASPLTWSEASFVRLEADIVAGRNVALPAVTTARYVTHTQGTTPLTLTAPADNSSIPGSPVTVTGTTLPGNAVYVAGTNTDQNSATTIVSTTADASGSFSVNLPVTGGTTVINVVAVSSSGGTGHASSTVVFDFVPGNVLLDVTDPTGDDNGPGNYAYPTSSNFKPGAFDIQRFQVIDSGSDIVFRVQTRDLTPTFGNSVGAQLVDVYVHVPGASTTSIAASFASRNYTIAAGSAWSRVIEVQGFGNDIFKDASGATLGTPTVTGNQISRFITFSVPKAALGTPGPGWGFTVVLTGQDGFGTDNARNFAPTPQDFAFGVCATASGNPLCTANPNSVPKAIDILTPPGVMQSDELDYTKHQPVTLAGVTIP